MAAGAVFPPILIAIIVILVLVLLYIGYQMYETHFVKEKVRRWHTISSAAEGRYRR